MNSTLDDDSDSLQVISRPDFERSHHSKRAFQKRRRSRACDACRKRKTKCDTQSDGPCSSCISASLECKFSEDSNDRRKMGPVRRLRQLETSVKDLVQKLKEAEARLGTVKEEPNEPQFVPTFTNINYGAQESLPPSSASESPAGSPSTPTSIYSHSQHQDGQVMVPMTRIKRPPSNDNGRSPLSYGPNSGVGFLSSVQEYVIELGVHAPVSPAASWENTLAASSHPSPPASYRRESTISDLRLLLPAKDIGDKLFDVYKCKLQRHMPMFYWPIITQKFEKAYTMPIPITNEKLVTGVFCVVIMVMAVAYAMTDDTDIYCGDVEFRRGWEYYELAKKYHDLNKPKFSVDDVIGAALPSPSWMVAGSLARVCQDIGLHHAPLPNQCTIIEAEHQSRLFWATYILDRKLALEFGRNPILDENDIDTELPGHWKFDGIEDETFSDALVDQIPVGIQIMRACIENAKIVELILELNVTPGQELLSEARVTEIETHLDVNALHISFNYLYPKNDESIDPAILKSILMPLVARLCLYRFFMDTKLSLHYRKRCFNKSLGVAKKTAKGLWQMCKSQNWEKGFRLYQCEMIYHHVFRSAVILLLGHQLHEGGPAQSSASFGEIYLCTRALEEAAMIHPTVKRSLELFKLIASALKFSYQDMTAFVLQPLNTSTRSARQKSGSSDLSGSSNHSAIGRKDYMQKAEHLALGHATLDSQDLQLSLKPNGDTSATSRIPAGRPMDASLGHTNGKLWSNGDSDGLSDFSNFLTPAYNENLEMGWNHNFTGVDWQLLDHAVSNPCNIDTKSLEKLYPPFGST